MQQQTCHPLKFSCIPYIQKREHWFCFLSRWVMGKDFMSALTTSVWDNSLLLLSIPWTAKLTKKWLNSCVAEVVCTLFMLSAVPWDAGSFWFSLPTYTAWVGKFTFVDSFYSAQYQRQFSFFIWWGKCIGSMLKYPCIEIVNYWLGNFSKLVLGRKSWITCDQSSFFCGIRPM